MYSTYKLNKQVIIYSLDVLLFLFGSSLLFHVQFLLLLLDLHTDFSGGRSGGLVLPSLSEFSTVCCDSYSQRLWHSQLSLSRCFSGIFLLFDDPADAGNIISGTSTFSKISLNIWKFMVHILLKSGLKNFEKKKRKKKEKKRILSITLLACEMIAIVW